MNKIRRKQLQEASELIAKAQGIIESVKDDEQEAHDNLPERFEEGECFLTGHIIKTDGSHDEKRMDDCPIIQRKKKRKAKRR